MTIEAYAKVNYTLEVYGVRPDGFHALRSVVLPISLSDTLVVEPAAAFSSDTGYPDDLCLKAARALKPDFPVAIHVAKRIPAGGGLGGGSADAAATLLAVNELAGLGHSVDALARIGATVGSDVPALVLAHAGGAVLMEGRGEQVSRVAAKVPSRHLVLANPGVASSTKEVYARAVPREMPADGRVNDLQAPAVALYPEIAEALKALSAMGAREGMMSGSGSTVYGFAASAESAAEIASALTAHGLWAVAAEARL